MQSISRYVFLSLCLLCAAWSAQASVVLSNTRVIYDGKEKEVSVKLENQGKAPALVQVWMDTGDMDAPPSMVDVPFTVTPPMTRIEAGKSQTLRMTYVKEENNKALLDDRESIFWLNVLEIPKKSTDAEQAPSGMQLAYRTRVKVFYRPVKMEGRGQKQYEATGKVTWKLAEVDGKVTLTATNPTPYHVSYAKIIVKFGENEIPIEGLNGMVRPHASQTFVLSDMKQLPTGAVQVQYDTITDVGGAEAGEYTINQAAK